MWSAMVSSYRGVRDILRRYWGIYGGARALFTSPYFHFAILLTLALANFWQKESWWDTALGVLPNVLGFTLAGFTIWLGFGDNKFQTRISKIRPDGKHSPFMGVSAGFAHFVLVQLAALLVALAAKGLSYVPRPAELVEVLSWLAPIGHGIGFLLFVYALMTALAASLGVFRAASWYDRHRQDQHDPEPMVARRPARISLDVRRATRLAPKRP